MQLSKGIFWLIASLAAVFCIYILFLAIWPRITIMGKSTGHKVYVAFGFHGNLYHSYRIDTNDEAGFGKDIRIIRKIINVLDEKNRKGVPVKGVWDIENLFSLQEQLPRYAPDIIKNIRRRVQKNGDEVILMSYNNGISSALNETEFRDSVARAISNREGSGVRDLFGKWSPYVRPQEMMATPGNYRLYKEMGLKGIVLYYSAITFDSFRVFERELSLEEAHNPLQYRNSDTGEEFIIIPAYNHGDLAENVGLRRWVRNLHREQLRGNIKRDVLLFINADADDDFWFGYKLPPYLAWLPNTGGLGQLIDNVADLDYVKFTTLDDYLKNHAPGGKVSFGQDTADGSFNGYVSWSEKAYCNDYWSRVTDDRRIHSSVEKICKTAGVSVPADIREQLKKSYEKRLRLESTTNYGMATPFLARTRERVVESIIRDMQGFSGPALKAAAGMARNYIRQHAPAISRQNGYELIDSFLYLKDDKNSAGSAGSFLSPVISAKSLKGKEFYISGKDGRMIHPLSCAVDESSADGIYTLKLFIPAGQMPPDGVYNLYSGPPETSSREKQYLTAASPVMLKNGNITITFTGKGIVSKVLLDGKKMLNESSFIPKIHYGDEIYMPDKLAVVVEKDGISGVASVRLKGNFELPVKGAVPGHVDYRLMLIDGVPAVFVDGNITYPDTPRKDIFKESNPSLARMYDASWREAMPVELDFAQTADKTNPFKVLKRNYLGVDSSYLIDYFKNSRKNLNLANVNNHITSDYVAVTSRDNGIAVAMDTSVLSNFAFSPLKISYSMWSGFHLKINPFGTYFGDQYYQPTWGNGQGYKIALLTGDQYHSGACTYSGYSGRFSLMVSFFPGGVLPEKTKAGLLSFANPPVVITGKSPVIPPVESELSTPSGFLASYGEGGVYFHWEKSTGDPVTYTIRCGTEKGAYTQTFSRKGTETTLFVKSFAGGKAFEMGKTYYATISAINSHGRKSNPSPEITFVPSEVRKKGLELPITLQLKVLWLTVLSLID